MSETGGSVFELFERVWGIPPDRRAAFLAQCGASDADRARVEAMLAADEGTAVINPRGGAEVLADLPESPDGVVELATLPTLRGSYRLIRLLGEGGSGAVYEAEQVSPRRRVAIKALKPELVSPRAVRLLRSEAEILARLNHPGIARVFEAGIGEEGRPEHAFIVMELVRGSTITVYAVEAELDMRARVGLIVSVCEAIEHAHQRGVIHRDLKPANIMVDEHGRPIVLDFGVARVVGPEGRQPGEATLDGSLVGTLAYMSPEQASLGGTDADVRSDVYAIGAVLYELTCGQLPLPVLGRSLGEALLMIDTQTPRPLSSVDRSVPRDLSVIVARALEKDRERRFATVGAMREELQRFLDGRPILSRPHSATYVLTRAVRRHRVISALVLVLMLTAVLFIARTISASARYKALAFSEAEARTVEAIARNEAEVLRARADAMNTRLESELEASRIGQGLLEARSGNFAGAEAILWPAYFNHPSGLEARGALWELFEREPCLWAVAAGNGATLIAASDSVIAVARRGGVEILDAIDGHRIGSIDGSASQVRDLLMNESGRLWIFHEDGLVRVFDASTQTLAHAWTTGQQLVGASLDLDEGWVATVHADGWTRLSDAIDGTPIRRWHSTDAAPTCAGSIGPGRLGVGDAAGVITTYDIATGDEVRRVQAHRLSVVSIVSRASSGEILSAGAERTLKRWDPAMSEDATVTWTEYGVQRLALNAEGAALVNDSGRVWIVFPGDRPMRPLGYTNFAIIDATWLGSNIATLDDLGDVRLWSTQQAPSRSVIPAHDRWLFGIDITSDGSTVVTGSGDEFIRFSDATGGLIGVYELPARVRSRSVAIVADGRTVAVACSDGVVRVVDIATRELVAELPGPGSEVWSLAVSPDGSRLAGGSWSRVIRVWNTDDFSVDFDLGPLEAPPRGLVFSPDGTRLYASGAKSGVLVIDVAGKSIEREVTLPSQAWSVAITPDGMRLAAGLLDSTACIVDLDSGAVTVTSARHRLVVAGLAFTDDGRVLVSGGDDGTVRLWEARSLREIIRLDGSFGPVPVVRVGPMGDSIYAGTSSGALVRWDLRAHDGPIARNEAIARTRLGGEDPQRGPDAPVESIEPFLFGTPTRPNAPPPDQE